ncbi:hypothetical protein PR048_026452 [Dryococelus australis]|uniref:Uncharacterized protein n=1 Tax=Dryococelus australis TaxID=614101 RepID=A0ABQ9GLC4_9NEOP|nr:hypothetical protein PR048_026452 [Dryococelus australis]
MGKLIKAYPLLNDFTSNNSLRSRNMGTSSSHKYTNVPDNPKYNYTHYINSTKRHHNRRTTSQG